MQGTPARQQRRVVEPRGEGGEVLPEVVVVAEEMKRRAGTAAGHGRRVRDVMGTTRRAVEDKEADE